MLAQMADLERGDRIKALREGRHLTQPAVAERVGVTLRAYQGWEAGGGIQWENAKRLGRFLGATPDYIMSGEPRSTPDLHGAVSQLDRIEQAIKALDAKLEQVLAAEEAVAEAVKLRRTEDIGPPIVRAQDRRRR